MMKKLFLLLLFLLTASLSAQHRVEIRVENPYTFRSVPETYVRVKDSKGLHTYFLPGGKGTLELAGRVEITVAARGFKPVYGHYTVEGPMHLGFLAEPVDLHLPASKPGILLDAVILDARTGKAVENVQVNMQIGKRHYALQVADGHFRLTRARWNELFSSLDPFTQIEYTLTAPGYRPLRLTDRLPLAYTVKAFPMQPVTSVPYPAARAAQHIPQAVAGQFRSVDRTLARRPATATACDRMPGWIRVGINCSCNDCNSVQTMGIETYVRQGLNDEWIASWDSESLKAGSLPYRTYGAYYVYHPIRSNYDISSTTCKQVWDSDYANSCVSAARDTQGEYLETAGGAVAFSEYSAENNCYNTTACSCGNGYSGNGSDWPCIPDQVCTGHDRYGHGRGMCQWGSQRWASSRNKTYDWINDHYYNPGNYFRCGTDHGHPDFGLTGGNISATNLTPGQAFTVSCTVQNNTAYRTDKNKLSAYWSQDDVFDSGDTPLDQTDLWPIDAGSNVQKSLNLQAPNLSDGNYYVLLVADADSTMYETDETNNLLAFAVSLSTTSVGEALRGLVTVYPNPAVDAVILDVSAGIVPRSLTLTDGQGRIIGRYRGDVRRIPLRDLSRGVYWLWIRLTDGRRGVFRVIKK